MATEFLRLVVFTVLAVYVSVSLINGQPNFTPFNFNNDLQQKILDQAPEAIRQAVEDLDNINHRQLFPPFCGRSLPMPSVPLMRHHAFLSPTERTLANAQLAFAAEKATSILVSSLDAPAGDVDILARQVPVQGTALGQRCPRDLQDDNVSCNSNATFRSPDGRCNNLRKPLWGAAGTAFARLVPPQYDDGISSPRVRSSSGNGALLPSARRVSTCTSPLIDVQSPNITLALVYLGQFIDHDFTLTPMSKLSGSDSPPVCCNVPEQCRNAECFPVIIPNDDPVFNGRDHCMEFSRSLPALRESCRLGHREQVTEPTQYLDNSQIYGSDANRLRQLRQFRDGLLKVSQADSAQHFDSSKSELLPADTTSSGCQQAGTDRHCFFAGDTRVNEQPMLAVYHTVMLREHNRIARRLKTLAEQRKLSTSDNDLFQVTRQIINAIYQHIVYNEFVPAVLGDDAISRNNTNNEIALCKRASNDRSYCDENGHYTGYDDKMPPHVLNEFATSAFRFGHSMLRNQLFQTNLVNGVANGDDSEQNEIGLADNFFRPFVLFDRDGVSSLMHGCTAKTSDAFDQAYVRAVRDELFRDQGQRLGFDLLAFDVQRGRDHGLPPYNTFRDLCGLGRVASFDELAKQLGNEAVDRLRCAYANVDDIDLYVGGVAEQPSGSTGIVGPTFGCIVAQQFHQTKKGDRFWFERPGRFTLAQLDEIRQVRLGRLICDNTDITRIQPSVLWKAAAANSGSGNDEVDCSELPALNLDEFASMLPERGINDDQPEPPVNRPPQVNNNNRPPPSNNRPPPPPGGFDGGFGNFMGGGNGGGLFNLPFLGGGGGGGLFPGFGG